MRNPASVQRPPLAPYHYLILGIQLAIAVAIGTTSIVSGSNADGFGDLVLVVGLLMMSLWIAGVVLAWAVARYFVTSPWIRSGIVLGVPGLGVTVFILLARG